MKNVELKEEDWQQFQERCGWQYKEEYTNECKCTQGKHNIGFVCAEHYCPRIKKEAVKNN